MAKSESDGKENDEKEEESPPTLSRDENDAEREMMGLSRRKPALSMHAIRLKLEKESADRELKVMHGDKSNTQDTDTENTNEEEKSENAAWRVNERAYEEMTLSMKEDWLVWINHLLPLCYNNRAVCYQHMNT